MAGGAPLDELSDGGHEDGDARQIRAFVRLKQDAMDAAALVHYAEAREPDPVEPRGPLAELLAEHSRESGIPFAVLLALVQLCAEADANRAPGGEVEVAGKQLAAAAERLAPDVAEQGLDAAERVCKIAEGADPENARAATAAVAVRPVVHRMREAFVATQRPGKRVLAANVASSSPPLQPRDVRPRARASRRDRRRACRGPSGGGSDDGPGEPGDLDNEYEPPPQLGGRWRV